MFVPKKCTILFRIKVCLKLKTDSTAKSAHQKHSAA